MLFSLVINLLQKQVKYHTARIFSGYNLIRGEVRSPDHPPFVASLRIVAGGVPGHHPSSHGPDRRVVRSESAVTRQACFPALRDAMNFVARSFSTHDTLRSSSAAMRESSAAVSSVVRIIICASFVVFPDLGLPRFFATGHLHGDSGICGITRQRLFAARFSVRYVGNCWDHRGYNFPFLLSEKLPQIMLDNKYCACILVPESEDTWTRSSTWS
jgi:hypothetical protein